MGGERSGCRGERRGYRNTPVGQAPSSRRSLPVKALRLTKDIEGGDEGRGSCESRWPCMSR